MTSRGGSQILFAVTALGTHAFAVAAPRQIPGGAPSVYVMRHLERTLAGDSLSAVGGANACRLARWFDRRPLAAIHVRRFARGVETVVPIARLRKLRIEPFDTVAAGLAAVRTAPKPVLVVGNSLNVQRLIAGVGGHPPAKPPYHFGTIWIVYPNGRSVPVTLPQGGPACEELYDDRPSD